jgi:hypothetical protein
MIEQFIITVLVIYGVKAATSPGMILEFIEMTSIRLLTRLMKAYWVNYISKPLFHCTPCMASVYGTISYWCYADNTTYSGWVIFVFAITGFNWILNKIINR